MPEERFLTPAEALGEDVVAEPAELEDVILKLDLVVAHADMVEKSIKPMDSVAFCAFEKYASEHPEEHWAVWPISSSDMHICADVVPGSHGPELRGAIAF